MDVVASMFSSCKGRVDPPLQTMCCVASAALVWSHDASHGGSRGEWSWTAILIDDHLLLTAEVNTHTHVHRERERQWEDKVLPHVEGMKKRQRCMWPPIQQGNPRCPCLCSLCVTVCECYTPLSQTPWEGECKMCNAHLTHLSLISPVCVFIRMIIVFSHPRVVGRALRDEAE